MAGFDYVSDEALCVGYDSGLLRPYPRPISLSVDGCGLLGLPAEPSSDGEVVMSASGMGGVVAGEPIELAHIVLLERRSGSPPLLQRPRADGMAALLRYSFTHFRRPTDAFRLASTLARQLHPPPAVRRPQEAARLLLDAGTAAGDAPS